MLQLAFLPCYGTEVDFQELKGKLWYLFSSVKFQLPLQQVLQGWTRLTLVKLHDEKDDAQTF